MRKKFAGIIIGILLITTITPIAVLAQKIDIIRENSPPTPPDITVPEKVKIGKLFNVTVVSTDPDGDEVFYRHKSINCTSSWFGPFLSGVDYTFQLKIIGTPAIYTIGVQAKDINEAESEWAFADINVPRNRANTIQFLNLLQINFNLFRLLQNLMGPK